jgi:tetraacyldisaccharide 4'-kinase
MRGCQVAGRAEATRWAVMTKASVRGVWERKGVRGKSLWLLLLPAAFLYRIGVQVRNALFSLGLLKSVQLSRPTVSVGNLTVGGTGKTPTCIWLAGELAGRGLKVGILSRGYGRHDAEPVVLQPGGQGMINGRSDDDLLRAGDEPLMMAQIYGHWVAVAKDRREAAAALLRSADVDVFILDDGYQHRVVRRDFDLLLLGNDSTGSLLPAGPFREPKKNLRRASGLLITGGNEQWNSLVKKHHATPCFTGALEPVSLIGLAAKRWKEYPLGLLCQRKILTVTGVADPTGLYRMIHEWEGEVLDTLEFPDHHFYTAQDWQKINRMARLVDLIITTEKDILKLARFPFAKDKLVALRVAMKVADGMALVGSIVDRMEQARGSRE